MPNAAGEDLLFDHCEALRGMVCRAGWHDKWVHVAKAAFEKYFLHKVRTGNMELYYERMALKMMSARRLKEPA